MAVVIAIIILGLLCYAFNGDSRLAELINGQRTGFVLTTIACLVIALGRMARAMLYAPLEIYNEQQDTIASAMPQQNASLRLSFDKLRHLQKGAHGELLYRIGVDLIGIDSIPRHQCQLLNIETTGEKDQDLVARLQRLKGCYLRQSNAASARPDNLPVDSGTRMEFDVIHEMPNKNKWRIQHWLDVGYDSTIPIGSYRLFIVASGSRVDADTIELEAHPTGNGRLVVSEVKQ